MKENRREELVNTRISHKSIDHDQRHPWNGGKKKKKRKKKGWSKRGRPQAFPFRSFAVISGGHGSPPQRKWHATRKGSRVGTKTNFFLKRIAARQCCSLVRPRLLGELFRWTVYFWTCKYRFAAGGAARRHSREGWGREWRENGRKEQKWYWYA